MSAFLGIDIGASSFKYGWGDKHGLQYFASLPVTEKNLASFKQVASDVLADVNRVIGLSNIAAIGIGTPGTIDRSSGKISGINPNLPFWTGYKPAELIPAELNIPVFCDNDANLMALSEAGHYNSQHALGITVGSGIGGGLVLGGALYNGAHGFAGEFGHMCMVEHGILCNCGRMGCLEAYASVDGIRRRLAELKEGFEAMVLADLLLTNDGRISHYLAEGSSMLVNAIVNVVTLLDIECVILGGGAMDAGMYKLASLQKEIDLWLPLANRGKVRIVKAFHGNRAGVLGAIQLADKGL